MFEDGKELHLEMLRKLALCGASIEEIPGRLVWNKPTAQPRRKTNLKIVGAASRHILYGLLIKPTRFFKYVAALLLSIGLYEWGTILYNCLHSFNRTPEGSLSRDIWTALSASFSKSPHTFAIASVALLLGIQAFSYLALLQVMKLQQEETLRHILAVLANQSDAD